MSRRPSGLRLALVAVSLGAFVLSSCGTRATQAEVSHPSATPGATPSSSAGAKVEAKANQPKDDGPKGAVGAESPYGTSKADADTPPRPGNITLPVIGAEVVTATCSGLKRGHVKVGSVGSFSDPTMKPGRDVLRLWAKLVNDSGGICGRKVVLLVRDDGGSAARAGAEVKDLVRKERVVALVGMGTAGTVEGYRKVVDRAGVPVIGGDLFAGAWNKSPLFFPQGASTTEQLFRVYRAAQVRTRGKKVALLYCAETAACNRSAEFQVSQQIPARVGSTIVYLRRVSRKQIGFFEECRSAKEAGAGAIYAEGDATLLMRLANSCGDLGIHFTYLIPSLTASPGLARNKYLSGSALAATPVAPWFLKKSPGGELLAGLASKYHLANGVVSAAYLTAALVAQQAITALGDRAVTRASLLASLRGKLTGFTAGGLTVPLDYRSGRQPQLACTSVAVIEKRAWKAKRNGTLSCRSGRAGPLPAS